MLANVTPQQLYGDLLGGGRAGRDGGAALPLRPRRDADPLRALGAAALAGRRAARPDGDRAPDARARRRLACGQRGRPRPAPRRGDGRRRPAAGRRPVAGAGRLRGSSGSSSRRSRRARKGDAAGELDVGDGTGRRSCARRYADRIQARIARHAPNFEASILRRVVLSPADIEAANVNMVGGDIYAGSCALDQNLLWRPRPGLPGHRTHVDGALAHRREHAPGPGARRRLGHARREGAAPAAPVARR